jgi:hypothetical protein
MEIVEDGGGESNTWLQEGVEELRAVWTTLNMEAEKTRQAAGGRIFWETNNRNGYKFLKAGARQKEAQSWATRVKKEEKRLQVEVVPIWSGLPTFTGVDQRGPGQSTDEWSVRSECLKPVLDRFRILPSVDGFATAANAKCSKFFSKGPQPGTSGINFFSQELVSSEIYYCCPPVKSAAHCIRKLFRYKNVTAVLVVPFWPSAMYWPLLLEGNTHCRQVADWMIWSPTCLDTSEGRSIFTENPGMKLWAGLIRTGISKTEMRNRDLICIISDHNMSYIHRELAMTSADEVAQALQQAARSSCLTVYNFRFTNIIL